MTEEEMIAQGKKVFGQCYGGVVPVPEQIDAKGYSGITLKIFNEIWGNDTLSMREKRLIVLGALAGLGADPSLFETHARSALDNGELNAEELRAAVLMALPCVARRGVHERPLDRSHPPQSATRARLTGIALISG